MMDIIFRSQFTLPPRTDLSIADTPNNRPYKTFLVRNLYTFYFRQCFKISFKFILFKIILYYSFNLYFSQFNGLFRMIKIKICRYFKFVFISLVDAFSREGIETWIQLWRFLLDIVNHLFFLKKISTDSNSILFHFVGWLFHVLKTLVNQWLLNYHINMISSNKLSLAFFFS